MKLLHLLVFKHQAINIHRADLAFIVLPMNITFTMNNTRNENYIKNFLLYFKG